MSLPSWSGTVTITGRTITWVSGSTFTSGYPGIIMQLEISPSVFTGVDLAFPNGYAEAFPPWPPPPALPSGDMPFCLAFWYVDATHLETDIDATYNLLIPTGTTAGYGLLSNPNPNPPASPPSVGAAVVLAIDILAYATGSSTPVYPRTGQNIPGAQVQFQAVVRCNTTIDTTVTWSATGPGSINSSTGLWTRSGPGIVTVTATSNQDGITTASMAFGTYVSAGAKMRIMPVEK
jgi:hypothetical protein